jgi:hypothetical protein
VLASKHPDARAPDAPSLHQHKNTPHFVNIDIVKDTVKKLAGSFPTTLASEALTAMLSSIGCSIGPNFGYFPDLALRQHNLEAAQKAFPDFGFKVTAGSRYLGGFVGEDSTLRECIGMKAKCWEEALAAFRGVDTFRSAKHKSVISEVKTELKLSNEARTKCESEMNL